MFGIRLCSTVPSQWYSAHMASLVSLAITFAEGEFCSQASSTMLTFVNDTSPTDILPVANVGGSAETWIRCSQMFPWLTRSIQFAS
ncbi:hypothetical protein CROQUDRAFT_100733 [Cronartium quercuum f. sp. fusiforme G11]|uniref:Uncharacterized protein n=1 Tax=Cronartium quercuum f. sp. fusiforme G11 TaxID=708437 RepID=A0A9P6N5X5_9BASI|nr:hypothetical protein CROQUDRAFT_100733 [Cronartium quercuum f. sp. fusiforme G11]